MAGLTDYLQTLQGFLRDEDQKLLNPENLIRYINRARRMIAQSAQCIRIMPPYSGQVTTITVTNGGSGYSANPTVTVSAPDFPTAATLFPNGAQATATALVTGGVITSIQVTFGGDGYLVPTVTITDSTGTGATATAGISPVFATVQGQEIYNFADIPLGDYPGVGGIYNIIDLNIIFANWQYAMLRYPLSIYMARIRQFPRQYQYVPAVYAQQGQGTSGSIRMYPQPNGVYPLLADCICAPSDLLTNDSPEAIPDPWTDAVPLLAAHLAYNELQNFNASRWYLELYDEFLKRYSAGARPGYAANPYGRL